MFRVNVARGSLLQNDIHELGKKSKTINSRDSQVVTNLTIAEEGLCCKIYVSKEIEAVPSDVRQCLTAIKSGWRDS